MITLDHRKNLQSHNNSGVDPLKFTLWLIMFASMMMFAGLVSAYIVQHKDGVINGEWLKFKMPIQFVYSTFIIVLSSLFIQLSVFKAKQGNMNMSRIFLIITAILGVLFAVSQVLGYGKLVDMGLTFSNTIRGGLAISFFYALTAVHVFHVLLGLILHAIALGKSFNKNSETRLRFITMTNFYWHFLGVLWIFLFLFLTFI